nr:integrase, catalytic region, zinc finger, CCHC-type, peptidase aspartic, catalytic [Tanacetum cinerariifolium]
MHNNSQGKKQEVEDHHRSVKLFKNKTSITACNDSLNAKTLNVKSVSPMCDKCVLIDEHDMCALKSVAKPLKERWYPKFTPSGYIWKPKSGKENVKLNVCMPLGKASRTANVMDTMTFRRSIVSNTPLLLMFLQLVEIVLFIVDSGCSKHMTGNLKLLINFVEKFLGTVKFRNDQIAPILGYGDLVQGTVMIKRVYYVKGLNHNLFSVGQFCDADLEVAFRKSTCFIRDLKGNDLLT